MTIQAKLALPHPLFNLPTQVALEQAVGERTTLFTASAGYLSTGHLSGILASRGAQVIWLRTGLEDRDPATLLLSLVAGAEEIFPGAGADTLAALRRAPGGVYGWAPLYAGLARDISARTALADSRVALVIQHLDVLSTTPKTLALLVEHFLPLLPSATIRILAAHAPLARGSLPGYLQNFTARDLHANFAPGAGSGAAFANGAAASLPAATLHRILALTEGRGVALDGVFALVEALGADAVRRAAEIADNGAHFLAGLAHGYLEQHPADRDLLSLALRLDYLHPGLAPSNNGHTAALPPGWLVQPLDGQWGRLRCVWREPLRQALRPEQVQAAGERERTRQALRDAAHFLIQQNALEAGIPLLLDLDYAQEAAQVLVQIVEPLMDRGQWETLAGWLARLPEPVRRDWPWLVYAEGELAAVRGQIRDAQRIFAGATQLFYERRDYRGVCQSLLTEGTLSAWDEEPSRAQQYAQQVQQLAGSAGLAWYSAWAGWLAGSLAAREGRLEEALSHFIRAANSAAAVRDPRAREYIELARDLAQAQLDLRQQKDQHRRALDDADRSEHDAADKLRILLDNPANQAESLLRAYGWSQVPMFLKLPQPPAASGLPAPERLLAVLLARLTSRSHVPPPQANPLPITGGRAADAPPTPAPVKEDKKEPSVVPGTPKPVTPPATPVAPSATPAAPAIPVAPATTVAPTPVAPAPTPSPDEPLTGPLAGSGKPALNAYLLGAFRVMYRGAVVESWPSGRARSLFAFLLAQRGRPVQREVIMDTFWPDATPDSARNSLNVAIYSLRQTLKAAFGMPLVLFHDNAYQIEPEVALWLDFDSFDRHVAAGRKAETAGLLAVATHQYELAISLYQGDLLVEHPYEDWPVVERERLRVLYMETLDHLSLIYYDQGRYAASAGLCQRMLTHDACREDAHCRLMRCYSRQGQNHLALRQYQTCVEALRGELDVAPSPATAHLYEQIRRRENI